MSQRPSTRQAAGATDQYEIRPFEPGDRAEYLTLFDRVLSGGDDEWFAWKYADNPFADHVPIVVATDGDSVVGAKSAVPQRVRVGDRAVDALQPADTMVDPAHRRQGLFSRMTEVMKERYADRSQQLFFNFPNEMTLAGGKKHGWVEVGRVPTYYRIQRTRGIVGGELPAPLDRGLDLLDPVFDAYLTARGKLAPSSPPGVTVEENEDVPADVLADLYERAVPDELHVERSAAFYDWRFENPKWTYQTYLAGLAGSSGRLSEPDVGVVVGTSTIDGQDVANVVDVAPLAGGARLRALRAALERVCERHADADVIAVSGHAIPADLLSSLGFLADTDVPLSLVSSPSALASHPLTENGSWSIDGRNIRRMDDWLVTFADQDTR
ncbi:Acetyltransferase (GNAT) domain-containing protein [Halomicrobium zhouii]|uniref:Acetyltransferase (GNAT) domain-containing protein n=1 Tax=Halomicrobium zhouii TaxID=767519 RepID=A0A1I6M4U3_9EURY|nr:GNAT family N-acetyltransferase [Halomicrobium zhouii]SFS10648.1 Acetyltransferase (GNAT) domain-containing protein [Halomicrobium zhouii]